MAIVESPISWPRQISLPELPIAILFVAATVEIAVRFAGSLTIPVTAVILLMWKVVLV